MQYFFLKKISICSLIYLLSSTVFGMSDDSNIYAQKTQTPHKSIFYGGWEDPQDLLVRQMSKDMENFCEPHKGKNNVSNPSFSIPKKQENERYVEASFYGVVRGLVALPIEHPFDCLKTNSQSQPHIRSQTQLLKNIYNQSGIAGFYAGTVPNATRLIIKQSYRWPMMLELPLFYDSLLPTEISEENPTLKKSLTGLSIASLETLIITPLERLKVWLMTSYNKEKSLTRFYKENQKHLSNELFRGLNASYPRQVVSWISFLVADEKFKNIARNHQDKKELDFSSLLAVGFLVGAVNTAATMPFDYAKTQLQLRNPLENVSLFNIIKGVLQNHGVRGLYAGWQPRMIQYMLQSIFTVTLIDRLEQK